VNLKVRKLSIDRHLMASAVTESVNTQHSFLHSCFVEPASQEVVKFLKSLFHFVSFHPGHIMAMSCFCRDIGLSQLKKIGFGHWSHLLSIAVGSGVQCLTIAIVIITILGALGILD
jgi:hypothetical protein